VGDDVQRSIANAYRDVAIKAQRSAARAAERARRAMEEWRREELLALGNPPAPGGPR
jgi:hypothetical protein